MASPEPCARDLSLASTPRRNLRGPDFTQDCVTEVSDVQAHGNAPSSPSLRLLLRLFLDDCALHSATRKLRRSSREGAGADLIAHAGAVAAAKAGGVQVGGTKARSLLNRDGRPMLWSKS
jgi:hypothetical protein